MSLDGDILHAVARLRRPWLNRAAARYSRLGNSGELWVAIGCAVALRRGTPRPAVVAAATVWGTLATNYAIKQVVRRARPVGEHLPAALIDAPRSTSLPVVARRHVGRRGHGAAADRGARRRRDGGEPRVSRRPLPVRRGGRRAGRRRLRRGRRYTRQPMTMIHIPAREGRGFRVAAGQEFRVIDPEGEQVADLFCFVADDPTEFLSAEHTRVTLGRSSGRRSAGRSRPTCGARS